MGAVANYCIDIVVIGLVHLPRDVDGGSMRRRPCASLAVLFGKPGSLGGGGPRGCAAAGGSRAEARAVSDGAWAGWAPLLSYAGLIGVSLSGWTTGAALRRRRAGVRTVPISDVQRLSATEVTRWIRVLRMDAVPTSAPVMTMLHRQSTNLPSLVPSGLGRPSTLDLASTSSRATPRRGAHCAASCARLRLILCSPRSTTWARTTLLQSRLGHCGRDGTRSSPLPNVERATAGGLGWPFSPGRRWGCRTLGLAVTLLSHIVRSPLVCNPLGTGSPPW